MQFIKITLQLLWNPYFLVALIFTSPLLKLLLFISYSILKKLIPKKNLKKRYSNKEGQSWALVANVNNDIRLSFCVQLIKQGFNIICVGNEKAQPLFAEYLEEQTRFYDSPSQIKYIHFNFQNSTNLQKFKEFTGQLTGLDICLLINNVQQRKEGLHSTTDISQSIKIININCIGVALLTNFVLKGMIERPQNSGIIHVSSIQGLKGISTLSLYSSTKSFVNRFSQGITFQYPNLDILNLISILEQTDNGNNFLSTNPASFASSGLRQLPFESQSFGPLLNQIIGYLYINFIPDIIYKNLLSNIFKSLFSNRHSKEE